MTSPTRIRAVSKDGITEVRILMSHEMETGQRRDGAGALVPAWFIQDVAALLNDREVLAAQWGPSIARNPYLSFKIRGGRAGDTISVTWLDNRGERRSDSVRVT
jgi:sulfur-oxidizing protein SoxZ